MSQASNELSFEHLSVPERIVLVQRIWDSIAAEPETSKLTESQEAELDRRVAEHESDPDDVITWEEINAAIQDER